MSKRKLLEEAEVMDKRKHKIDLDAPTDDEDNYDDGMDDDDVVEEEKPVPKKNPKADKKKKNKKNKQEKVVETLSAKTEGNVQKEVNLFIKKLKEKETRPQTWHNKQKVLILCSRGTTATYRHVLNDLRDLLPHHKSEAKFDAKHEIEEINEVAELRSCNNILYFDVRRVSECYLWASKAPNGPSVKFQVHNAHSSGEFTFTGNCLKGSRPVLCFDKNFDTEPHYQLIKEMFTHIFATPKGHPNSKPFVDHVLSFFIVDGKIWFRNYQIVPASKFKEETELIEVGPRFILDPIKICSGSMGGPAIYQNGSYISPGAERALRTKASKKNKNAEFVDRVMKRVRLNQEKVEMGEGLPKNVADEVFEDDDE